MLKLTINNFKIIKEAEVELPGLTVIAGKNDTGKTTVAKCLYSAASFVTEQNFSKEGNPLITGKDDGHGEILSREEKVEDYNNKYVLENGKDIDRVVFIESPTILDFFSYIQRVSPLLVQKRLDISMDEHKLDLIMLLAQDIPKNSGENDIDILYKKISDIIDGDVYYDPKKNDVFYAKANQKNQKEFIEVGISITDSDSLTVAAELYTDDKNKADEKTHSNEKKENYKAIFKMSNTANGIKMFGYLQILLLNKTIKNNSLLILDEPEVHIHPAWQLKYAEIIMELVKTGVRVLINSHSPYMIESLQRYAEKKNIKSCFYLAKDGCIKQKENSNNITLSYIFEELSEPFATFDKMDSENLQNG